MVASEAPREQAAPTPRGVARWLARLHASTAVGLVFGLLLVVLLIQYRSGVRIRHGAVVFGGLVMALFAGLAALRHRSWRAARALITDWLPVLVCVSVYENLHDLTRLIRPDIVDPQLARLDQRLFGVQPTLWLQRIVHPALTDYLSLCYTSYFFVPPLLAGWLWLRGHVDRFREFQLQVLLVFFLGFVGYVIVPAIGPRFVLSAEYTVPLTGLYFNWSDALMTRLEAVARDCFPSLHTGISTTWLIYAIRRRALLPAPRVVLPILTVITVSLWFSTIYLRYHWVVDVFAGWALAVAMDFGARWLYARWPRPQPA